MICFFLTLPAGAQSGLDRISTDKFTNSDSVHKTEVEPASFAWGSTIVSTFHVARRPDSEGWGSGDIGFATSTDGGATWKYGYLPGLTVNYGGGSYGAVSDPAVAYDAKHGQWLISSLPLVGLAPGGEYIGDVAVSRSPDGLHWGNPAIVDSTHLDDKTWVVCDNTATSPYYGNCYTEWDQAYGTFEVLMSTSSDGGQTWGPGLASADGTLGTGAEPIVQPNGTVIVPFEGYPILNNFEVGTLMDAFSSTNGGTSWGDTFIISDIDEHLVAGDFRDPDFPASAIDGQGKIYVVWHDCRFRANCTSNDIVMSSSADGQNWSDTVRIPIDPVTSTVDHFMAAIGADPTTSGDIAHLTIVYYYYPVADCGSSCQLYVGYTCSQDGGNSWTAATELAGPIELSWLPYTDGGYMIADYVAVSYSNGNAFGFLPVAKALSKGLYHEAIYANIEPLPVVPGAATFSSRNEHPIPNARSDHMRKLHFDEEGRGPFDESRRRPADRN